MLKAIETRYNGYRFRSRLEARWAVFFDALGVPYEYEKEGFDVGGVWYLPDFYLPRWHLWLEIKPTMEERKRDEKLHLVFSALLSDPEMFGCAVGMPQMGWIGYPRHGGGLHDGFFVWFIGLAEINGSRTPVVTLATPVSTHPLITEPVAELVFPDSSTPVPVGPSGRCYTLPSETRRAIAVARECRFEHRERPVWKKQ